MNVQGIIGWNTARLRQRMGLSQQALAQLAGTFDQSYVSGLENGRRNPTAVILVHLATALDVQVGELFSINGAPRELTDGPVEITSGRAKRHRHQSDI